MNIHLLKSDTITKPSSFEYFTFLRNKNIIILKNIYYLRVYIFIKLTKLLNKFTNLND